MSKRARRMRAMMGMGFDFYADDYECWTGYQSLSDKEIENATPKPYPQQLLRRILGLTMLDAFVLTKEQGYSLRVIWRDDTYIQPAGTLERDRINIHLEDDKIVEAFVG